MEVTWDKGSSGLVFWTDEQFWRETGHGDSDEADDWDVDMEGYEVEGGGDLVSFKQPQFNHAEIINQIYPLMIGYN